MPETLKDCCRLCLSSEGLMLPIFRNEEPCEGIALRSKIMSCAAVEIFADDGLPTTVCHVCVHQVEKSFQFKRMCEKSEKTLQSQVKLPKVENEEADVTMTILTLHHTEKENGWSDNFKCISHGSSDEVGRLVEEDNLKLEMPPCSACNLIFPSMDQLFEHLIIAHENLNCFSCNLCNISYPDFSSFKLHVNIKHSLTCSHCDYVFKYQTNLNDHKRTHLNLSYICRFCSEKFEKIGDMRKHELDHLERICRFCSKEMTSKELCLAHVSNCAPVYRCKFCDRSFQQKKDLIEHVNDFHDVTSPNKCNRCLKNVDAWEKFEDHNCLQEDNDGGQCGNCKVKMTDLSPVESDTTLDNDDLLTCRFCSKVFNLKRSLRRHEKSHSGFKPYECKYCNRKFKDNNTCIVHMRTHTGEHPFQCQECHKDFKQLANLKMHTYRHHKKIKIEEKHEGFELSESNQDQTYHSSHSSHSSHSAQMNGNESMEDSRMYQTSVMLTDMTSPFANAINIS